jgi:hypothetical protein
MSEERLLLPLTGLRQLTHLEYGNKTRGRGWERFSAVSGFSLDCTCWLCTRCGGCGICMHTVCMIPMLQAILCHRGRPSAGWLLLMNVIDSWGMQGQSLMWHCNCILVLSHFSCLSSAVAQGAPGDEPVWQQLMHIVFNDPPGPPDPVVIGQMIASVLQWHPMGMW